MSYEKEIDHFVTESGETVGLKDTEARKGLIERIVAPQRAQIGQTIVVVETDENGVPTRWEPAYLNKPWRFIGNIVIPEDNTAWQNHGINVDMDGNPFCLSEAIVVFPKEGFGGGIRYIHLNESPSGGDYQDWSNVKTFVWFVTGPDGLHNVLLTSPNIDYWNKPDVQVLGPITSVTVNSNGVIAAGKTITVWGKDV